MNIREILQRHIIVVGILIVVVGLIAASDRLHDRAEELIVWTEGLISQAPALGMLVFVLLAMISAMLAFFSSAVVAPVAIYAWGKTLTFLLLWVGWLLGGILSYCIARYLGRSVVSIFINKHKIEGWERELGERARFPHILVFQAAVPSEIPGYVLGILRYHFHFYLAALALSELPYAIATVYLGESFLERDSTIFVVLGFAVVILGIFLLKGIRTFLSRG